MIKKLLLTGIAALFLATGTAHAAEDITPAVEGCQAGNQEACALVAKDTRKWIWRCALVHTPSDELMEAHEQCCKRWPNAPHCNGDYTRAMSLPRCAKLPHLANIKCAERILLKINPRPR